MRLPWATLPLKVHYFLFLGSVAPMLPFLMVVGMQLGVPVQIQGSINALVLVLMVFIKPLIAAAADSFPALRKSIFLLLITLTATFFSAIWLIEPFSKAQPQSGVLQGRMMDAHEIKEELFEARFEQRPDLFTNDSHSSLNRNWNNTLFFVTTNGDLLATSGAPPSVVYCRPDSCSSPKFGGYDTAPCWTLELIANFGLSEVIEKKAVPIVYQLNTNSANTPTLLTPGTLRLECSVGVTGAAQSTSTDSSYPTSFAPTHDLIASIAAERCDVTSGEDDADGVWGYPGFYLFCLLMFAAVVAFSTTNSITDAICMDTIGSDGDYGAQRAWGSVGWGLVGLLSGALVDWWSAGSPTKDYTPAFLLLLLLGAADVAVSAVTLKVPKLEENPAVWRSMTPLLMQPRFVLFLLFVVANGCMDGIVANFIFVLQEEVAACTPAMQHIKLLQGLTLVVQSGAEIPFMFLCDRLSKRFGPERLTTLVFGAYGVRLLMLSLMGYLGNVWLTLLAEALNGPCFGLGYTAIVLYAGQISAPGTSATVQSLVNICYEAIGYALSSAVGGLLIQSIGGPANYLVFGVLACLICPLHLAFTTAFPAPTKQTHQTRAGTSELPGPDLLGNTIQCAKEHEEREVMMSNIT